jgi:hypothetical protein
MRLFARRYVVLFVSVLFVMSILLNLILLQKPNINCRYFNHLFEDPISNFPWNQDKFSANNAQKR